jgi:hypothetical protein
MEAKDIVLAIQFIRPNAEFSWFKGDLIWSDEIQTKPTDKEIKAGYVAYQAAQAAEAETKAQVKSIAQAKLTALGLTVEDLQALGL